MVWVKFHEELRRGAKRGLPRAVRFVFLELCLEARPGRGAMDLPVGMNDLDALHDVLGGNRKEISDAVRLLTTIPKATSDEPEPRAMIELTGEEGARRLTIPSWEAWNSQYERPGSSTERSRKSRASRAGGSGESPLRTADDDERNDEATAMQRSLHDDATTPQRGGNDRATQHRGEERREEEIRSDPPYPPQAGEAGRSLPLVLEPLSAAPAPKKRREGLSPSEQAYSDAYVAGQEAAEPGCGFRPLTSAACRLVGAAAQTHAKDRFKQRLTGDALLAWIRETSAEFRRAAEPQYAQGYSAHAFGAWLDAGRPMTRREPLPEPSRIIIPERAPPPPKNCRMTADEQARFHAEILSLKPQEDADGNRHADHEA